MNNIQLPEAPKPDKSLRKLPLEVAVPLTNLPQLSSNAAHSDRRPNSAPTRRTHKHKENTWKNEVGTRNSPSKKEEYEPTQIGTYLQQRKKEKIDAAQILQTLSPILPQTSKKSKQKDPDNIATVRLKITDLLNDSNTSMYSPRHTKESRQKVVSPQSPRSLDEVPKITPVTNTNNIQDLQQEWEHLITLADQELKRRTVNIDDDALDPEALSTSPNSYINAKKKQKEELRKQKQQMLEEEARQILDRQYKETTTYWKMQEGLDHPAYGFRSPSKRFGYLSSYAKRHSIKNYLTKNPENQDCFRRKTQFTVEPKRRPKSTSKSDTVKDSGMPQMPLFKKYQKAQQILNGEKGYFPTAQRTQSKGVEEAKQRLIQMVKTKQKTETQKSDIASSASEAKLRSSIQAAKETKSKQIKYVLLKKQNDKEFCQRYINKLVQSGDTHIISSLQADEKVRQILLSTVGELVLSGLLHRNNKQRQGFSSQLTSSPNRDVESNSESLQKKSRWAQVKSNFISTKT